MTAKWSGGRDASNDWSTVAPRPPAGSWRLRRRAFGLAAAAVVVLAACSGPDDDDAAATPPPRSDAVAPDPTADPSPVTATPAEPTEPTKPITADPVGELDPNPAGLDPGAPDLGRVVALAEEPVLADLLALGIEPIASTASVDTAGFQGIADHDVSGIEVLPMTTLSLEYLAGLRPDTIVTLQFWVDQVGADALEGMADVIVIPDGLSGVERIETLGELVGRPQRAAAVATAFDAALAAGRARIADDCEVSLAAIYPGPSVAAFVAGPWEIPASVLAMGCELEPDTDDAAGDTNGRAWLSLEQLGLLGGDTIVLLQSDTVDGESESVAEIRATPLWATLPAVVAGQVVVSDRLGYPGVEGEIRFIDEFSTRFAG